MVIYPSSKVLPYVYQCVHKTTGKIYIGSRTANTLPSSHDFGYIYKTSSKIVKPIFDEFDWHIVAEFFDPHDAYDFEQQLIHEQWQVLKEMSLNGFHHYGKESWNVIGKESHRKGKILPEEHKKNMRKPRSEEFKIKMRKPNQKLKGIPRSKEIKQKIGDSNRNKPKSEEHKKNMRKPRSDLGKKNIKESKRVEHSFLTPDGFVIENTTMKELCSQFNLNYNSIIRYFREQRSYKGFILISVH